MKSGYSHVSKGFTLIELLTVIAIIGILAGIIIPTTGAVRTAAKKSQAKAQFSQLITAFTLFKQEYGYLPKFDADGAFVFSTNAHAELFAGTLTGKALDGSAATTANLNGNKKKSAFYSLSDNELDGTGANRVLMDAFGNKEIGIIVDTNGDGRITIADDGTPGAVASVDGGSFTPSTGAAATNDIPTEGVRASVLIYSAGKGGTGTVQSKDAVMSWK